MTQQTPTFDARQLEDMNEKALRNQFFTPDVAYLDLGLLKDLPIGAIYTDLIVTHPNPDRFQQIQQAFIHDRHPLTNKSRLEEYQVRQSDSIDRYWKDLGYTDVFLEEAYADFSRHDAIFLMAPPTKFLGLIARHMARNQNNSRPAFKYEKIKLDKEHHVIKPIDVSFYINTYPLTLSPHILKRFGEELGELMGVNIHFINKNPSLFDKKNWDAWMNKVDCYYFDSLGAWTKGDFIKEKQGRMELMGRYVFARKRFEHALIKDCSSLEMEQQIQIVTAQFGLAFDFEWIQNNDVRLTEQGEHITFEKEEGAWMDEYLSPKE